MKLIYINDAASPSIGLWMIFN